MFGESDSMPRWATFGIMLLVFGVAVGLMLYADFYGNTKMYDQMVELVKTTAAVILGAAANQVSR